LFFFLFVDSLLLAFCLVFLAAFVSHASSFGALVTRGAGPRPGSSAALVFPQHHQQ
jgi:hypothetical protein